MFPLESRECGVRVTMNVDSRQNKKARNFMFFCSYIIQFLLSFSKTFRGCYRMNEARFSSIHFFIIMSIYLFHCEELYGCLNFAGLHSMRGRCLGIALQRGKIFLCVSSCIKCKLQYLLYFYVVRSGNLYMCMGGKYLLIGHCFLK